MALYPKNKYPFDDKLFEKPSSEYRGAPFWAWNCQMTTNKCEMMLDTLKEMGMGGAHIHCRDGMNNVYLGNEFMELVKYSNKKMRTLGMRTYLYDEDRWPSGSAGGYVTKDTRYRMRFLVFSPVCITQKIENEYYSMSALPIRSENRTLLARYQVKLLDGWLEDYQRIAIDEKIKEGYEEWFAYLEISGDSPAFNNQAYVNTLDKRAIDRFIEVTHEAYAKSVGDEFGQSIHTMFTDEPQFAKKGRLGYAGERKEVIIPFTDDLDDSFADVYGCSLLEHLPEIFWEKGKNEVSQIRYWYHDHVCERFTAAFADNIGNWCQQHGLLLTGHVMGEPTLMKQTMALGEAMRAYRSFQLPGIDMLYNKRELSTAKQAQSASRQFGCPGVLSELYGVTNWDYDFRGHKLAGDWQAALGVTTRVHHLSWTSMEGEAKRDYPASIAYQSPWYKEYRYVEDYFARINTLLTRGKSIVHIGVIHPIESYWLFWGCEEKTGEIRKEMEEDFEKLIEWLLYNSLDFDFICESLLGEQNELGDISKDGFKVGEMTYDVIVVPNCITLRESTYHRLKKWEACGGTLIFTGKLPQYIEGVRSKELEGFVEKCKKIPFSQHALVEELEPVREVEIRTEDGLLADNLIYQLRKEEDREIFFLAHVHEMKDPDIPQRRKLSISISGSWNVVCYNPLDGSKCALPCQYTDKKTTIIREMYDHDSLLLVLQPMNNKREHSDFDLRKEQDKKGEPVSVTNKVAVSLSEPNVLLLDLAEYAFDEGEWKDKEEVLRIDNAFRKLLNYPQRVDHSAQPWVYQEQEKPRHKLSLRFTFSSEVTVKNVQLAMENKDARVWFNGQEIELNTIGWYVDCAIECYMLGDIRQGENELIVQYPFGEKTNVEAMYILGDFGVRVFGSDAMIVSPVDTLSFGDWTRQGLPFYGGNVTYHIPIEVASSGELQVEISKFRNPLLKVSLDDKEKQVIAYSPYRAEIYCEQGEHILNITAYGNRVNTFGALHNCKDTETWFGPIAWRSSGTSWAYEYQLKQMGILKTPILENY